MSPLFLITGDLWFWKGVLKGKTEGTTFWKEVPKEKTEGTIFGRRSRREKRREPLFGRRCGHDPGEKKRSGGSHDPQYVWLRKEHFYGHFAFILFLIIMLTISMKFGVFQHCDPNTCDLIASLNL